MPAELLKRIEDIKSKGYQDMYTQHNALYYGDAHEVFQTNRVRAKLDDSQEYLSYNIFSQITDTYVNLMLYEKPRITFKNSQTQSYFDDFINESFFEKIKQLLVNAGVSGDAVAHLNIWKNEPEIVVLPNTRWIPLYNPDRPDLEADSHAVEYKIEIKDQKPIFVYQIFDNENLNVGYVAFQDEEQVKVPDQFILPEYKTDDEGMSWYIQTETPLFFRFYNKKRVGQYFGVSDYSKSIINKSEAINNQIELTDYIITKAIDPILTVPKNLIKQTIDQINNQTGFAESLGLETEKESGFFENSSNNNFKGLTLQETMVADRIVRKSKIIPISVGDEKPEYITVDLQTEKMANFIEMLKTMVYNEAKLSPILFDKDVSFGNLSGVALQRLIQQTLHNAQNKITAFEEVLKEMIYSICVLAAVPAEVPTIEWYDGIIDSKIEKIDENERLLLGGFITKKEAIKNINGLTDEQAVQELTDIEAEQGFPNAS
jgi:hypothetical protein